MRRFELLREFDLSGVSGTGVVAEGVEFSNGSYRIHWLGKMNTFEDGPSVEILKKIHGHGGSTLVIWIDQRQEER